MYSDHTDPRDFIEALEQEIVEEAQATREHCEAQWQRPPDSRLSKGVCLRVSFVALVGQNRLRVRCVGPNHSRFREGDILRLNRGDPFQYLNWDLKLEEDNGQDLTLSMDQTPVDPTQLQNEPDGWFLDESYLDTSQFYLKAIDHIKNTAPGQERVLPFLMGKVAPRVNPMRGADAELLIEQFGLNASQEEALLDAVVSEVSQLVQGPPGTGKTLLLALLTRSLVAQGEKVLVTALTHRAIGNALNKIAQVTADEQGNPTILGVKIEPPGRRDKLAFERLHKIDDWPHARSRRGFVVGATPFACWTQRLEEMRFDTIIFDEASQVTIPLAVMAMLRGKKFLFFGDHQQLPPVYVGQRPDKPSIFSLLQRCTDSVMLDTTYRMNRALTEWSSGQFYHGRLVSDAVSANRRLAFKTPPQQFQTILNPAESKVLIPGKPGIHKSKNKLEAERIAQLCRELVNSGIDPTEIGIVTPYRYQGRCLREALRTQLPKRHHAIVADTVERMQGQERDVIFLSLTTTDPAFAQTVADFYFQPQRLNVAVTRARKKLIVFACPHIDRFYTAEEAPLYTWKQQIRSFFDTCHTLPWDDAHG